MGVPRGLGNGVTCSPLPRVGSSHLPLLRKPSQKNNHPFYVQNFHMIPAFTLCPSCLPARRHSTPSHLCLISSMTWFKNLKLQRPQFLGTTLILYGRILPHCGQVRVHPRNGHVTIQWLRVYGKASRTPRLAALSWGPHSHTSEQDCSMLPAGSFFPGEAMPPLPNALQYRELFLPMWPRVSLYHAACSWVSTLLPHRSTAKSTRYNLGNGTDV